MRRAPSRAVQRTIRPLLLVSMPALALGAPAAAALTLVNTQAASLVLGQPDFTSNSFDTTQPGMYKPSDIAVDPTTGKVFVVDYGNSRVLRFASAALSNGSNAEAVLGQPDFTSRTTALTQSGMKWPQSAVVDSTGRALDCRHR